MNLQSLHWLNTLVTLVILKSLNRFLIKNQTVCFFWPSAENNKVVKTDKVMRKRGRGVGVRRGGVSDNSECTHRKSAVWSLRVWETSPWVCPSEGHLSGWPVVAPRAASSSQRSKSSGACPCGYPGSQYRKTPSSAPRISPGSVYTGWSQWVAPPWPQNSGALPDQEWLSRETKQKTWRYIPSIFEYGETNWKNRQILGPDQPLSKSKLRNVIAQLRTLS